MASTSFIDKTTLLLKKNLDLRQERQQIIASNIANAQTPCYKAKRLEFQDELRQAVEGDGVGLTVTNSRHISASGGPLATVHGKITEVNGVAGIGDGNTVDVDQEMILLAKNQLMYEASVQLLNKKMGIVKYVVQGN
ncbi:MAG: flagellar basal-body rod protein FlgB [Desulfobacteraceae bacterium 4572_35.1]|nr:MAG: flagellar basal-body rod protein FlgB [Desulfobacteraceae bacterium 4572_35.1]